MGKLNKAQKRKQKVKAKRLAAEQQQRREQAAFDKRFNEERKTARIKIRQGYRDADMSEEQIQRLVPEDQDEAF
jgi:hypothetical protein